jgi:hypothetical protein
MVVERKGDVPNLSFKQLVGTPQEEGYPMAHEDDHDALQHAIDEVLRRDNEGVEQELLAAGRFVARFGCFGDVFDDDQEQFLVVVGDLSAWGLMGHWSVERNDPDLMPPPEFEEHIKACQVCDYLEGVRDIRTAFEYEDCEACGRDLDEHDIAPDLLGKAHASCKETAQ